MNFDWQNAAVLFLVVAACGYLARLAWQSVARRRTASCGACGTCPADAAPGGPKVIGISSAVNGQDVVEPAAAKSSRGM